MQRERPVLTDEGMLRQIGDNKKKEKVHHQKMKKGLARIKKSSLLPTGKSPKFAFDIKSQHLIPIFGKLILNKLILNY